jgi:hypothetical protein
MVNNGGYVAIADCPLPIAHCRLPNNNLNTIKPT